MTDFNAEAARILDLPSTDWTRELAKALREAAKAERRAILAPLGYREDGSSTLISMGLGETSRAYRTCALGDILRGVIADLEDDGDASAAQIETLKKIEDDVANMIGRIREEPL